MQASTSKTFVLSQLSFKKFAESQALILAKQLEKEGEGKEPEVEDR